MKVQQWEYKSEKNLGFSANTIKSELNKLGSKGWELVSITDTNDGKTFFFKRPKQSASVEQKCNPKKTFFLD